MSQQLNIWLARQNFFYYKKPLNLLSQWRKMRKLKKENGKRRFMLYFSRWSKKQNTTLWKIQNFSGFFLKITDYSRLKIIKLVVNLHKSQKKIIKNEFLVKMYFLRCYKFSCRCMKTVLEWLSRYCVTSITIFFAWRK